jgi:hypothetical protein
MKTDEWKQIVVKSPKLGNFRKGLRTILKLAIGRKVSELSGLKEAIRTLSNNNKELTSAQVEKERVLSKEVQDILGFYDRSILRCSFGGLCESANRGERHDIVSLGLDMIWDPVYRNWHCLKCHDYYLGTEGSRNLYKKKHDDNVALWDELAKDLES